MEKRLPALTFLTFTLVFWVCVSVFGFSIIITPSTVKSREFVAPYAADPSYNQLLRIALYNLHTMKCDTEKFCTPTNQDEIKAPPLTHRQVVAIVNAAFISADAQHCNLDWQERNFEPMMNYYRNFASLDARQLALAEKLHTVTMLAKQNNIEVDECNEDKKIKTEKQLMIR